MTAYVFGELTADGKSIILIAESDQRMTADADAEIGQAAALLQLMTPLIKPTEPAGALTLPCSWPAVVQLSASYGQAWRPGPVLAQWIADQIEARTGQDGELTVTPPPGLVPRSYQVEGARMIAINGRALLFDEQRTGKTITAILGAVERQAAGHNVLPMVVVCPAAVIDPWVRHFRAWAPRWRVTDWRGPNRMRKLGTADVYVTSYDTARRDAASTNPRTEAGKLMAVGAHGLIIDECHRTKDPAASQTRAVLRLAAKADGLYVALSGTPITHHPGNLYPALQGLEPAAWPSGERWKNRYCLTVQGDYSAKVLGLHPHNEGEFRLTILGRHRRVARADVLNELPKTYLRHDVEVPEPWRKAYDDLEQNMLAELPDGTELSSMTVLDQINLLSRLASAAADMEITTEAIEDRETGEWVEKLHRRTTLKLPSWKVDALLELMAERPEYATVTFAPSKQLVMLAGHAAEQAGYKVGYVVGGQRPKDRTAFIDAFQARELDLLCCTTGAGGTGLTLSAADSLIFLQRHWSLVESSQAEDRAEGDESKTRGTEIIDIVARNTIETRIRAVLKEKAGSLAELLQDPRIVRELLGGDQVQRTTRKKAA